MTRDEQRIEQVAGIILEGILPYGEDAAQEAQEINDGDGWTYEVRYDDQEYNSGSNYTRVEGDRLSNEQLTEAIGLAHKWQKQGWR